MLDANTEISRLRSDLLYNEVPLWKVDDICDMAAKEISDQIVELVADALERAATHGIDVGADDFVNQLTAVKVGNNIDISTVSGKTDFTEPPFPMLPKLLKNAKTAKDGSQYKVIPLGGGGTYTKPAINIFDAAREINNARQRAKELRDTEENKHQSNDVYKGVNMFSGLSNLNKIPKKTTVKTRSSSAVDFKTASSKQDPNTQWVRPQKELDMSRFLIELNTQLENDIDETIRSTINNYRDNI